MQLAFSIHLFKLLFLPLFMVAHFSFAQSKRVNNWYFNHLAGIDFNKSPAVPTTDGKIDNSSFTGSASISDENGNLLFYTDSYSVWNRKHEQMPNGFDLTSGKINITTQTSVIVPKPGTDNIYYIFTVNPYNNPVDNGLYYAVVDMKLEDGFGNVTLKNQPLRNPVSNGLTAVRHANGQDYWVIANEQGTYNILSYKVTANGVVSEPVVSRATVMRSWLTGQMKASPDGNWLAVITERTAELFTFNTSTGQLGNPLQVLNQPLWLGHLRGLEFSPNSGILYVAAPEYKFYQFSLLNPKHEAIKASVFELPGGTVNGSRDMQLGPDGKIYVAKGGGFDWGPTSLAVINNPNQMGLQANYQEAGFPLGGRKTGLRLPAFVTSFLATPMAVSYANHCQGEATTFTASNIGSRDSVEWNFDDPASGNRNTSSALAATHTFSAPGNYRVKLTVYLGGVAKVLEQQVTIVAKPAVNLGPAIQTCSGTAIELDAGAGETYLWSTGQRTRKILVTASGQYTITVSNGSCSESGSVAVTFLKQPVLALGPDILNCVGAPVTLTVGAENENYRIRWSTGETTPAIAVTSSGVYWAEVTNDICTVRDEITIDNQAINDLAIKASNNTLAYKEVLVVEPVGDDLISWNWDFGDGNTTTSEKPAHTYEFAGKYTVTLTAANRYGCSASKQIEVVILPYIFVPNIFTPNNDGKNDTFRVTYNGRGRFDVVIYNRWGKEVYRANTLDFEWTGDGASAGVYFYHISTETDSYKGTLTLSR